MKLTEYEYSSEGWKVQIEVGIDANLSNLNEVLQAKKESVTRRAKREGNCAVRKRVKLLLVCEE